MNIKKLLTTTAITLALTTTSAFAELRTFFKGANGGVRYIENVSTQDNITTFTVKTKRADGTIRIKEFTATKNGDSFNISGNGKETFKNWLSEHAAVAQNISIAKESITKNEIAFAAWKADRVAKAEASGSIFLNSFKNIKYVSSIDYVDITEATGIDVDYSEIEVIGTPDFSNPIDQVVSDIESINDVNITMLPEDGRAFVLDNGQWIDQREHLSGKTALYALANVNGLEEVHEQGWTGKGVKIGISDASGYRSHGHYVADAARFVAPGATIQHYDGYKFHRITSGNDIVNISSGSYLSSYGRVKPGNIESLANHTAGFTNGIVANNPGALFVTTHPNANRCNAPGHNAANCSGRVAAHDRGLLNGDWIFVRAEGPNYTSHAAGDSDIKNHTITADGTSPSAWRGGGTSFAAPKVSGAAALIMHKFPNLNAGQVKDRLLESADRDFNGYSLERHGKGILNVLSALSPQGNLN